MFVPGKPFQTSPMFMGKATLERSFTRVGSSLLSNCKNRLERLDMDKHSSLLQKFVNCGCKKIFNIGPRSEIMLSEELKAVAHWKTVCVTMIYLLFEERTKRFDIQQKWTNHSFDQGTQKGEVSLYYWPPVWLVWNQLYDNW